MKTLFLPLMLSLLSLFSASAQNAPQAFNFQAVARTATGEPLANQNVSLQITILGPPPGNSVLYRERHNNVPTTAYGLMNVSIGRGQVQAGTFAGIDWSSANRFVQVEIDPAGGTNFQPIGSPAQLLSVPYALYSNTSGSGGGTTYTAGAGIAIDVNNEISTNAILPGTPAGGSEITGNFPNLAIAAGAVTNAKIATGAVDGPKIAGNAITTDKIADGTIIGADIAANTITGANIANNTISRNQLQNGTAVGQVLRWDGAAWQLKIDSVGAGTTYTPGPGIKIAGDVISADSAKAIWNANQLQSRNISPTAPSNNQVLKWNGTAWTPGNDSVNVYNAGNNVNISGTYPNFTISVDSLNLSNIRRTGASNGQVLKWNSISNAWVPANDSLGLGILYTEGPGINITGTVISADSVAPIWNANQLQSRNISPTAPSNNQVLKWNSLSSIWIPQNDSINTYTGGAGIGISGANNIFVKAGKGLSTPTDSLDVLVGRGLQIVNDTIRISAIDSTMITTGSITGTNIKDGTITGADIANNTITEIKLDSISVTKLKKGTAISGQVLKWNGTQWEAAPDQTGSAGGGISDLNGSIESNQSFSTGSTGTDFTITTNTGSGIHTFNIPSASSSARGLLTPANFIAFNNKIGSDSIAGGEVTGIFSNLTIANNVIDSTNISTWGIGRSDLADGIINEIKISNNAVTGAKIATNAIDSAKIADGGIIGADIKIGTVTGNRIADNTITGNKILNKEITFNKLADGVGPGEKILKWNGSIWELRNDSIGAGTTYTPGPGINVSGGNEISVKAGKGLIIPDSLEILTGRGLQIFNDSVRISAIDSSMITDGGIIGADLKNQTITGNKIANGTITYNKLANGAAGQILKWNGSWALANDSVNVYTPGTGISISGNQISANTTDPIWNANQLQGRNVVNTAPSNGQVLRWNGTNWAPADTVNLSGVWKVNGNTGVDSTNNFIGTTDNVPLNFRTNGIQRMRINRDGNVGIGTLYPGFAKLHVSTQTGGEGIVMVNTYSPDPDDASILILAKNAGANEGLSAPVIANEALGKVFFGGSSDGSNNLKIGADIMATAMQNFSSTGAGTKLEFRTANIGVDSTSTKMTILPSGNIGIGTTGPNFLLDVNGKVNIKDSLLINGVPGTNGQVLTWSAGKAVWQAAAAPGWALTGNGGTDTTTNFIGTTDAKALKFRTNGIQRMVISHDGNVGIGGPSTGYKLSVNGYISTSNLTESSDIRYKKNISTIDGALDKLTSLRGVNYEWKREEFKEKNFKEGKDIGFVAQEIEKILPEVVHTDSEGYKSVEYGHITALLVEAVKEQQKLIEAQQKEISQLKAELTLEKSSDAKLQSLEASMKLMQEQIELLQKLQPVSVSK